MLTPDLHGMHNMHPNHDKAFSGKAMPFCALQAHIIENFVRMRLSCQVQPFCCSKSPFT